MTDPNVVSVERFIASSPDKIFDLLADPSRHQEIDGSGTVREAGTGSQRVTLGSTFSMSMNMGLPYTMVNTVVEFEEDKRIAWQPRPANPLGALFIGGRIWRYELQSQNGGTLVKESWDIRQERLPFLVRSMSKKVRAGMEQTLARIDKLVAT